MVKKYLYLFLFIVISTNSALADYWGSPKIITTYSDNKEYMLMIYPIKYPNNYFTAKYQRQLRKGIITDSIVPAHAVLYRISNSDTIEVWDKPLVNSQSPVNAIVANDGKSVITIDDWHNKGYEHTFVIYGEDGELIKDFELKDITPFPLDQYLHSISSIHWGGNVEYLDNGRVEILFKSEKGKEQKRIFNIKTSAFE